jgi:hypothetical protein
MASSHGVLPRVIGHRGAAGWAPENTLASIRKAKELGVAWVEVDVMLTRDKVRFPSLLRARTRDDAAAGDLLSLCAQALLLSLFCGRLP